MQPLRKPVFQRIQIVDEHGRVLAAVAVEQQKPAVRLLFERCPDDGDDWRNSAARRECEVGLAAVRIDVGMELAEWWHYLQDIARL